MRQQRHHTLAGILAALAAMAVLLLPTAATAADNTVTGTFFPAGDPPSTLSSQYTTQGYEAGYICQVSGFWGTYLSVTDCRAALVNSQANTYVIDSNITQAVQATYPIENVEAGRSFWSKYGWLLLGMAALVLFAFVLSTMVILARRRRARRSAQRTNYLYAASGYPYADAASTPATSTPTDVTIPVVPVSSGSSGSLFVSPATQSEPDTTSPSPETPVATTAATDSSVASDAAPWYQR